MGSRNASVKNMMSALAQMYPPKSKFSVDQIPDLSGRVALVTGELPPPPPPPPGARLLLTALVGGNVGIGYETCKV